MPAYRNIDDFPPMDTYKLIREVPTTPANVHVSDAWWTVKASASDPDSDAYLAAHITSDYSPSGYILNRVDDTVQLYFVSVADGSPTLVPSSTYYYDIQVKLDNGEVYTLEYGNLFTLRTITKLSS